MAPRIKVILHDDGMSDLLHEPGLRAHLMGLAERVRAAAVSAAPVQSGTYRDSIRADDDVTDRVVARVIADAPYSLGVEAKTGNLSRALDVIRGGQQMVRYKTKSGKTRLATQAQVDAWTRGSR